MIILQSYPLRQLITWVLMALVFIGSGCTTNYYYSPGAQHNLRLYKAKQAKGEAGIFRSAGTTGFVTQAAYSPYKHIGLQANYFNSTSSPTDRLKMQEGNVAIGTYYLQKLKSSQDDKTYLFEPGFLFDLYAGIGIGQNKNQITDFFSAAGTTGVAHSTFYYHTYYIQAGAHFQSFKAVAIGYTFRFFYLDYKKVSAYGSISENFFNQLNVIQSNDPFFMRENSFKLSIGREKINYYVSANFLSSGSLFDVVFSRSSFQSGMEINISELFRKKNSLE